ncbi:hypothetical protein [Endozoicomonas sp. ONNA2]|uniref:hypothetical protein n=1 Tax=Endozoicomonas sp. ONNA2 TaxID=2828741 RepID=UPI0021473203|nr:hypothetical protein [Endozoicomonas sp. ONNA2]
MYPQTASREAEPCKKHKTTTFLSGLPKLRQANIQGSHCRIELNQPKVSLIQSLRNHERLQGLPDNNARLVNPRYQNNAEAAIAAGRLIPDSLLTAISASLYRRVLWTRC